MVTRGLGRKRVALGLLVGVVALAGIVPAGETAAGRTAVGASAAGAESLPAQGAGVDSSGGRPRRVVHRASGIAFVLIPAGEFLMGSPESEAGRDGNERRHRRVVRRPFYVGETEVTVAQFRRFVGAAKYLTDAERGVEDGGHARGSFAATPDGDREWHEGASWRVPFPNLREFRPRDDHPVVHVSWNDAAAFAAHYGMRLPTEAEWEYAARAGSRSRFFWGDGEAGGRGYGNVQDAAGRRRFKNWNVSFPFDDGVPLLAPAGRFRPNAWGLRDVVGNVSEWCQDVFARDYPADGADESAAEGAPGAPRVMRGGSWLDAPDYQRSAKRLGFLPQGRRDFIGFRVAMDAGAVK